MGKITECPACSDPACDGQHGPDDPVWDGTDAAHPAWWRGASEGKTQVVIAVNNILDGKGDYFRFGDEQLEPLRLRLVALIAKAAK